MSDRPSYRCVVETETDKIVFGPYGNLDKANEELSAYVLRMQRRIRIVDYYLEEALWSRYSTSEPLLIEG